MAVNNRRREFLKKAAILGGIIAVSPSLVISSPQSLAGENNAGNKEGIPILRPGVRMNCLIDGSVELSPNRDAGQKFVYAGFEAAVLIAIASRQPVHQHLEEIAFHNNLSYNHCKANLNPALDDFERKGFIGY
ncbi:MAG TPA: hypothetical protein VHO72_03915 [Bacteroidales bacterium]|nr:hypothetical protein [Bacteroidales bacterium]